MKVRSNAKTVKYLKNNNGSWTYRRRVPKRHHKTLGFKVWNRPCGDLSYQQAVSMVTNWTVEDNALIAELDDPKVTEQVRQRTEVEAMALFVIGMIKAQEADVLPVKFNPMEAAAAGLKAADQNLDFDNQDRLIRYRAILEASFGSHVVIRILCAKGERPCAARQANA